MVNAFRYPLPGHTSSKLEGCASVAMEAPITQWPFWRLGCIARGRAPGQPMMVRGAKALLPDPLCPLGNAHLSAEWTGFQEPLTTPIFLTSKFRLRQHLKAG